MGLFDKIKGKLFGGSDSSNDTPSTPTHDYDPENKPLSWFESEDGLESYKQYINVQSFLLEETIKDEKDSKYAGKDYSVSFIAKYLHHAKIPYLYFESLIENISVQPLKYVGPIEFVIGCLEIMAKPFDINDDGEPEMRPTLFAPEDIVSVEKNPILKFISNFDCFDLDNSNTGSWKDKYLLYTDMIQFFALEGRKVEDYMWVLNKDTYFNEFGIVRKEKAFLKKCKEIVTSDEDKDFFDRQLARIEE